MSSTWRLIFVIGTVILAAMALYATWFETLAPIIFVKAFVSLVLIGLVLTVLQSAFAKPSPPANSSSDQA